MRRRRSGRRRPTLIGACLAVLTVIVLAAPAEAALSFGSPRRITRDGCGDTSLVLDPLGRGRGFATCWNPTAQQWRLAYVQTTATSSTLSLTTIAADVLDVADDGVNTYALYQAADRSIRLTLRTRAGRYASRTLAPPVGGPVQGSVIGHQGRWWAVWSAWYAGCNCPRLWTARTMLTGYGAHVTPLVGREPALANRGSSAVLAWTAEYDPLKPHPIAIGYPQGTGFTRNLTGQFGGRPSVDVTGGVLRLAYVAGPYPHTVRYRELIDGRYVGRDFAQNYAHSMGGNITTITTRAPVIAVTTGGVTLGWTTLVRHHVWSGYAARRVNGTWTTGVVGDGLSDNGFGGALASLGAVAGRPAVVLTHMTLSGNVVHDVARR